MRLFRCIPLIAVAWIGIGCGGEGSSTGVEASSKPSHQTGEQVVKRLQAAGVPIDASQDLTSANDPNELLGRPGQYIGKILFHDSRLSTEKDSLDPGLIDTDTGGSIEVFKSDGDASKRAKYVRAFTEGGGLFAEYNYLRGTTFVRVTGKLTPDQVQVYERASKAL